MSIRRNTGKRKDMTMGGTTPPPPTRVKLFLTQLYLRTYNTTYMERIGSQFIQKEVDHVDPHTQLLPTQAQCRTSIHAH